MDIYGELIIKNFIKIPPLILFLHNLEEIELNIGENFIQENKFIYVIMPMLKTKKFHLHKTFLITILKKLKLNLI